MRLFRGAPVPMTTEGVGEMSGLADALVFFGFSDRDLERELRPMSAKSTFASIDRRPPELSVFPLRPTLIAIGRLPVARPSAQPYFGKTHVFQ